MHIERDGCGGVAVGDLLDQANEGLAVGLQATEGLGDQQAGDAEIGEFVEVVDCELAVAIGVGGSLAKWSARQFADLLNQLG